MLRDEHEPAVDGASMAVIDKVLGGHGRRSPPSENAWAPGSTATKRHDRPVGQVG
jgi:hypothetical protein